MTVYMLGGFFYWSTLYFKPSSATHGHFLVFVIGGRQQRIARAIGITLASESEGYLSLYPFACYVLARPPIQWSPFLIRGSSSLPRVRPVLVLPKCIGLFVMVCPAPASCNATDSISLFNGPRDSAISRLCSAASAASRSPWWRRQGAATSEGRVGTSSARRRRHQGSTGRGGRRPRGAKSSLVHGHQEEYDRQC
jgi:hypothetical protein